MAAIMKQIKTIVPAVGEYATLVHPNTPSKMPTANTTKVMALFVFPVMFTSLSCTPLFSVDSIY